MLRCSGLSEPVLDGSDLLSGTSRLRLCQVQNGQFTGVIEDPTGANVPNARILIKNLETGYELVVHSNEVGIFAAQGADGRSLQTDGGSCRI